MHLSTTTTQQQHQPLKHYTPLFPSRWLHLMKYLIMSIEILFQYFRLTLVVCTYLIFRKYYSSWAIKKQTATQLEQDKREQSEKSEREAKESKENLILFLMKLKNLVGVKKLEIMLN